MIALLLEAHKPVTELPVCCRCCGRIIGHYSPPIAYGRWFCRKCRVATELVNIAA